MEQLQAPHLTAEPADKRQPVGATPAHSASGFTPRPPPTALSRPSPVAHPKQKDTGKRILGNVVQLSQVDTLQSHPLLQVGKLSLREAR